MGLKDSQLGRFIGGLACWLGMHDFRVVEATFGFGPNQTVEKVECRRCGLVTTRRGSQ